MDSQPERQQRRCLGALYHSQARLTAGKEPVRLCATPDKVCAGLKRKLQEATDGLPKESVPAGDFKYMCIGYSVYDKERKKQEGTAADVIELPYCEGLEVISAAELLKTPAVLNEGTAGASVAESGQPTQQEPRLPNTAQPRPGRNFVPGDVGTEWNNFSDRFMKTSKKVVDRMGSNLAFMGRTAKQTLERLSGWRGDD